MYHGYFAMSIFELESKERSNYHVELCQWELPVIMCSRQLWHGRGDVCVRACDFVWVYVCVCLWLWLLNDERRGCVRGYAPINKLWTTNSVVGVQNCSRNDVRTASRGRKWGPSGLHMRSKWATWGAVEVSLRPRSPLDLAKGFPKSIFTVPIKHFGILFGIILEDLGD